MKSKHKRFLYGVILASIVVARAQAQPAPQPPGANATQVTVDNFIRAESDMYAAAIVKDAGGAPAS